MFHKKNYDSMNARHILGPLHGLHNIVTLRDKIIKICHLDTPPQVDDHQTPYFEKMKKTF